MQTKGLVLKPNPMQKQETLNKVFYDHVNQLADYGPDSKYTKLRDGKIPNKREST